MHTALPPQRPGFWAQKAAHAVCEAKDGQSFSLGFHHWTNAATVRFPGSGRVDPAVGEHHRFHAHVSRHLDGAAVPRQVIVEGGVGASPLLRSAGSPQPTALAAASASRHVHLRKSPASIGEYRGRLARRSGAYRAADGNAPDGPAHLSRPAVHVRRNAPPTLILGGLVAPGVASGHLEHRFPHDLAARDGSERLGGLLGKRCEMAGLSLPAFHQAKSISKFFWFVSGSRAAKAPQKTPTTEHPLRRSRFAFALGMVPLAKPMTSRRPSHAMQRSDCSKTSPPTGSYTTSAPPPVIDLTASFQSGLAL
jgi:hypothetical protein